MIKKKLIITILKVIDFYFFYIKYMTITLWILTLVNSWKLKKLRNQYFHPNYAF